MSREYTNMLLEWMDGGYMDPKELVKMLIYWMSEEQVEDMCRRYGWLDILDEEE